MRDADAFPGTLTALAGLMRDAREPWWIIGSAAVALYGAGEPPRRDVDVLAAVADLERLRPLDWPAADWPAADWDARPEAGAARFRSTAFRRWRGAQLPVELMADLSVRSGKTWHRVALSTRVAIRAGDATLWVPSRAELIELLLLFGRAKDRRRAAALAAADPVAALIVP